MSQLIINNNGDLVFENSPYQYTDQKNNITLSTKNKFIDGDISLTTLVTKAVLNKTSGDTDHKIFSIQFPNGTANPILLTFTTDTTGNTVVTGTNVTT